MDYPKGLASDIRLPVVPPDLNEESRNGNMKYSVKTLREAGLQARWTKTRRGAPIISASNGNGWYVVDKDMWESMKKYGVMETFSNYTLLGDYFSIPV